MPEKKKKEAKKATPEKAARPNHAEPAVRYGRARPQKSREDKKTPKDSFSIIKTGGKQYKVSSGDLVRIEKIIGKLKVGDTVTFGDVLLSKNGSEVKIGTPLVPGAKVSGILERIGKGKKVVVIKYKQKSRYFKNRGHRQPFMQVRIK